MNCCVCLELGKLDVAYGYVPADTTVAGYATCQFHAELLDVCAGQLDPTNPPLRMALHIISGKIPGGDNPAYDDLFEKYGP